MPSVHIRAAARRDLIEHFAYLAEHATVELADRFLVNAERAFLELAHHPSMGAPLTCKRTELRNLRKWRVAGFEDHLIFYVARPDGVSIVRVLHAASDWWSLIGLAD